MSYFKAKMHQIRFRPGLHSRPRWRSACTALHRHPSWIHRVLLLREGGQELGGETREEKGREKGEGGREGGAWRRERKEGRGERG